MKAWHFVADKLRDGSPIPTDGVWLEHTGPMKICKAGLHASVRLIDALEYAPGATICRVEVGGEMVKQKDKLVCRKRKILWRIDATMLLHEFACQMAEGALKKAKVQQDERCWKAIKVKREWMAGRATDAELDAARDAAMAAAWDAAWDAARAAAWDAARAAARAAARDAARDAANRKLTRMVETAHKKGGAS